MPPLTLASQLGGGPGPSAWSPDLTTAVAMLPWVLSLLGGAARTGPGFLIITLLEEWGPLNLSASNGPKSQRPLGLENSALTSTALQNLAGK